MRRRRDESCVVAWDNRTQGQLLCCVVNSKGMMGDKKAGDWIEVGEIVLVTSGEYSSYGVSGLYRALQRFQLVKVADDKTAKWLEPRLDTSWTLDPAVTEEIRMTEVWAGGC